MTKKQYGFLRSNVNNFHMYSCVGDKFNNAEDTLKYVSSHKVEVTFINIELNGIGGLWLGEKLREINPKIVLVFFTEHTEYTLEALRIKTDDDLIKPYTIEHRHGQWKMQDFFHIGRRKQYIFGRLDDLISLLMDN